MKFHIVLLLRFGHEILYNFILCLFPNSQRSKCEVLEGSILINANIFNTNINRLKSSSWRQQVKILRRYLGIFVRVQFQYLYFGCGLGSVTNSAHTQVYVSLFPRTIERKAIPKCLICHNSQFSVRGGQKYI